MYVTFIRCPVCKAEVDKIFHAEPQMSGMGGALLLGDSRRIHAAASPPCRGNEKWQETWVNETRLATPEEEEARKPKKPKLKTFILDKLIEATKFPLYFRLACKIVNAGYTEAEFHAAMQAGDFDIIPEPLVNDVYVAVRDIENKRLPKISESSGQRLQEIVRAL